MHSQNTRRGVSLIEVLVVIGIMATLMAFLVPKLRFVSKDLRIDEAKRVVSSAISSARQRAISHGAAAVMFERRKTKLDRYNQPTANGHEMVSLRQIVIKKTSVMETVVEAHVAQRGDDWIITFGGQIFEEYELGDEFTVNGVTGTILDISYST